MIMIRPMSPITPEKEIHALITLLADDNDRTAEAVTGKLLELGVAAQPALTTAAAGSDPVVRMRAQAILRSLRIQAITDDWRSLFSSAELEPDLEKGAFLIGAQAHPDLDIASYRRRLDALADEIVRRMGDRKGDIQVVKGLNQFLFHELGLRGNNLNYYDAENSYIHRVLDRLMGIPISLSVVYLLIARRLNLPVYGVGTPGHFLLKYETTETELYIDSFNGGNLMDRQACIQFLRELGFGFEDGYLDRAFSRDILARMIRNLLVIYKQTNDADHAAVLEHFLKILTEPEVSS